MLEKDLIVHCAPTLAGIKCAGLFNHYYASPNGAIKELSGISQKLSAKGVQIEALTWRKEAVLIYLYRPTLVERQLRKPGVRELLQKYDYPSEGITEYLQQLKKRIRENQCFPHEIGIFLGYPLEDVIGFIENRGKNCKYCGFWKVYCNEEETKKYFTRLEKCNSIYSQIFAAGRSLIEMTVVA